MADKENNKYLFRDSLRILLLPGIVAGGGVATWGSRVLSTRIDNLERDITKIERRMERDRSDSRLSTLEARIRIVEDSVTVHRRP